MPRIAKIGTFRHDPNPVFGQEAQLVRFFMAEFKLQRSFIQSQHDSAGLDQTRTGERVQIYTPSSPLRSDHGKIDVGAVAAAVDFPWVTALPLLAVIPSLKFLGRVHCYFQ